MRAQEYGASIFRRRLEKIEPREVAAKECIDGRSCQTNALISFALDVDNDQRWLNLPVRGVEEVSQQGGYPIPS